MRKLLYTSAFVCLHIAFLHAQDWNLFPVNNHMYYQHDDMIYTVTPDSTWASADTLITWLQRSNTPLSATGCTDEIEDFTVQTGAAYLFPYVEKMINVGGNTTLSLGVDTWDIYFNTKALEGDTFHLGGMSDPDLYVECTDIILGTVFGVDDSIREYTIYRDGGTTELTDQHILLSKTFGLIAFYDLYVLSTYDEGYPIDFYNLIGYEGTLGANGFKPPFWKDYFPLQVTDVLIWDRHISSDIPWDNLDYHLYYKDSVISRTEYPDSIVFSFERWKKDTSGIVTEIPTFQLSYSQNEQVVMFEGPTGRYKYIDYASLFYSFSGDVLKSDGLQMIISDLDTIYACRYSGGTYFIYDEDDCTVWETFDVGKSFTVQTDHGLVAASWSVGKGSDYVMLVGGNINGEAFGDDDFETVDIVNALIPSFSLFPNPASEAVNIVLPDNVSGDIRIFNTAGNYIVRSDNNIGKLTLDTSNWPSGIYLVQVVTNAGSSSQRLMKF